MFESLIYSNSLTYAQGLAWQFCLTSLVWGFSFLIASYILYRLSNYVRNKIQNKHTIHASENLMIVDEALNLDSSASDFESYIEKEEERLKGPGVRIYQALYIVSSIMSFFACFCIGMAPSVLSSLGVISIISSIGITLVIVTFKYFGLVYTYCPRCVLSNMDGLRQSIYVHLKKVLKRARITTSLYKKRFIMYFVFAVTFSIATPLMTAGSCLTLYNDGYGFSYGQYMVSTTFTRHLDLDTVCQKGRICHVYATLPEDGSTAVFINVHTGNDIDSLSINYDTVANQQAGNQLQYSATAASFYPDLETRGDRYVHSVYLGGLQPNTAYYLEIFFNNNPQANYTYLTFPSTGMERNILIAAGGSVGNTATSRQMTDTLGHYYPDVFLIGGDLAYDNGIPSCYYSYDLFLQMFENINANSQRLIPLMLAVGDHDMGFSSFQDTNVDVSQNLFFTYFPQQSTVNGQGQTVAPSPANRSSYFYHKLGNSLHVSLDTGYIASYSGSQLSFLKSTLKKFPNLVNFGNYHMPMMAACFSDDSDSDDIRTIMKPQMYWAPVFQEYRFATVFENHNRMFKKTFPIFNGAPNPGGDGVMYLGDGNWGVEPSECWPGSANRNDTGVFELASNANNAWLVNITSAQLTYFAVDPLGNLLEQPFSVSVSNYITD